jgi:hypothetical protein
MEAIVGRNTVRLGPVAADWLRATRRMLRALARAAGYVLINYSKAALMLRGRDRPFRRI